MHISSLINFTQSIILYSLKQKTPYVSTNINHVI